MPEMPEVETIRRVLEPEVEGRAIRGVDVRRPEVVAHPGAAAFASLLEGAKFDRIERRGKYLVFVLEDGRRIVAHLRMTGCFLLADADQAEEKHTHVVFALDDGCELRFSDSRRFGRLWLFQAGEPDELSGMGKLGIEPVDEGLDAAYLQGRFGKRRKAVKECLLDQGVVAGIGNIYADEILFAARIAPDRPAASLTDNDWERLAAAIPDRLEHFIEKSSMTLEDYLAGKGREYRNAGHLQVYGRAGEPCPVCGSELKRIVVGGRGSTYCPACSCESCQGMSGDGDDGMISRNPPTTGVQLPTISAPQILTRHLSCDSE